MATDLYLIRHGESVANVEPIIGGMTGDAGLTDRGRRQAAALERRLTKEPIPADHLYASTLPRALETAAYVSRALGLPFERDDEVQELRPGLADGMSMDEWLATYPGWQDGPLRNPFHPMAPEGESWAQFLVRAGAALTRLVRRHPGETVVVVTHGGVIESSFYLALGLGPTSDRVRYSPRNTCLTHWRYLDEPDGGLRWDLVTFNDAWHLNDPEAGEPPRDAVPTPA
ncbi:MAG: histidine phosphatase family protein [Propionibacteriaceae bacterium]